MGPGYQMNLFLKTYTIKPVGTLSVRAPLVFEFFDWFVEEKIKYKNEENVLILKFEPHHNFCPAPFFLCHWSIFSSVHRSLDAVREGKKKA